MTFRFPIPRDERIVLALGTVVGLLVPAMIVFTLREVAGTMELSFGELLELSSNMRTYIALLGLISAVAAYALSAYAAMKSGETMTITPESVRYVRPGVPIFGVFARDVALDPARIDRILVKKGRVGTNSRVEVECGVGHDAVRVNLEHAIGPGLERPIRRQESIDAWLSHPLVEALAGVCRVEPRVP